MPSIKVNYQGKKQRTSTTFTETMARYFIRAWYGMQLFLEEAGECFTITDKHDLFYQDLKTVKKTFQKCINNMMVYIDALFLEDGLTFGGWSKRDLEHYMLYFIRAEGQGDYLNDDFVSWN